MAGGSEEALDGGGKELSPDFEGDEPPESDPVKAEPATVKQEEDRVEGSTGGKDPQGDAQASENVQREANEDKSAEGDGSKPWIPDRVKRALQRSSTFDEFRKNRPFRYLHMFSGEKDQLGESIKKEAKAARLEVYVESLDRKRDSEVNLASHTTYDEIDKSVTEGEWDGYHSGFPCSSFSRVRWRDSPGGLIQFGVLTIYTGSREIPQASRKRPMRAPLWRRGRRGFTRNRWSLARDDKYPRYRRWRTPRAQRTQDQLGTCPKSKRSSRRLVLRQRSSTPVHTRASREEGGTNQRGGPGS
jgi:hypothetical protein